MDCPSVRLFSPLNPAAHLYLFKHFLYASMKVYFNVCECDKLIRYPSVCVYLYVKPAVRSHEFKRMSEFFPAACLSKVFECPPVYLSIHL